VSNVKVNELMSPEVLTASVSDTVQAVRDRMASEGISALPVVNGEDLMGIVTATDVLRSTDHEKPVSAIMSEHVFTVPPYVDVHVAARVMRNHGIHHVVVTLDQKIQGIVASYDLLELVEQHRYVAKNKPSTPKRRGGRRRKLEKRIAEERKAANPEVAPSEDLTRARLEAVLTHLTRRTVAVDRDRGHSDEPLVQDFEEQAVVRANDEVLDALSAEGHDQIELVGRALERLDAGEHGKCEDCSGSIGPARMHALPYAVTCIECARKRETASK
jgi:RNA polymerase-binding transcription factor DksA